MRFKRRHGHAESSQNVPLHSHHFQAVHCQRFQFVLFCTRPNDCISKVRNKPVEVAVAVALVSALEECIPQVIIQHPADQSLLHLLYGCQPPRWLVFEEQIEPRSSIVFVLNPLSK